MTVIRKPYGRSERLYARLEGESMTQQSHKDACDVNNILKRFQQTGVIEHRNRYNGVYTDFVDAPDYHTAMTAVVNAQQMFEDLPSQLRKQFGNDPAAFLHFVDHATDEQLIEAGLMEPPAAEPAVAAAASPPRGESAVAQDVEAGKAGEADPGASTT